MAQEPWTWAQIPDQTGRVAIVTGATSGTGFEAARILAACGATVILACRNLPKAEEAARRIAALHPGARVEVQALDLASQASVRAAAADLLARFERAARRVSSVSAFGRPAGTPAANAVPHERTGGGDEQRLGRVEPPFGQ